MFCLLSNSFFYYVITSRRTVWLSGSETARLFPIIAQFPEKSASNRCYLIHPQFNPARTSWSSLGLRANSAALRTGIIRLPHHTQRMAEP
jgi:hypothetical protein